MVQPGLNAGILTAKQVRAIKTMITEQWGVSGDDFDTSYVWLQNKKDRVYIINRDLERVPFEQLRIAHHGLYFCSLQKGYVRLSMDGSQMIGPLATKRVADLPHEYLEAWMQGEDIDRDVLGLPADADGFWILRYRGAGTDDYLACGFVRENVLENYMPKNRRIILTSKKNKSKLEEGAADVLDDADIVA